MVNLRGVIYLCVQVCTGSPYIFHWTSGICQLWQLQFPDYLNRTVRSFTFEGSFIWVYQNQMAEVMCTSEGWGKGRADAHQAFFEGMKGFPFWGSMANLNCTHSLEETFWKGERFQSDRVCYSSSTLKTTNHLALQQATSLWGEKKKKKTISPPNIYFLQCFWD